MRITDFKKFEAISPSQFRPYMNVWTEDPLLRDRYKDIFETYKKKFSGDKNAYRIYLPLVEEIKKSETEIEITGFLDKAGYDIIDYIAGQAKFRGARNPKRIGQVITGLERNATPEEKLALKDLMKKFIEDPNRKQGAASKYLVCISRHPYDIAGADTNRKWENCMTLGTENGNHHYLIHDVKEGSLVGYLIEKDDKNIKDPIANCAIKPYLNVDDESDVILVRDPKTYPQPYPDFERTVTNWLDEVNGGKQGIYCLNSKLYNDNRLNNKIVTVRDMNPEIIKKIAKVYGIKLRNLIINDDMSIDVKGDVDLSDRVLTKFPLVFNRVFGNFRATDNNLTTLEGSPCIVDGDFLVYNNKLESLKGGPTKVGGEYSISTNNLKSLDHCPTEVGSHFDMSFNKNLSHIRRADVTCQIGDKFVNRGADDTDSYTYEGMKYLRNFKNF